MGSTPPLTPTILPLQSPSEFARRLVENFPPGWAGPQARTPGGVLYAVMQTIGSQLSFELGSPLTQIVTLGGTPTAYDVVTIVIAGNNFQGTRTINYGVNIGDTLSDIANALALGISADPILSRLGMRASANAGVVTIAYPNMPTNVFWSTAPPLPNVFTVLGSSSLDATETIAVTPGQTQPMGSLQYAWSAVRVQIAQGNALDLASADFFGTTLRRVTGEPDTSYRSRILAALVGSSRVDLQACKLEYSIVSPK